MSQHPRAEDEPTDAEKQPPPAPKLDGPASEEVSPPPPLPTPIVGQGEG